MRQDHRLIVIRRIVSCVLLLVAGGARAAEPSAHDPQFGKGGAPGLWPGLAGKEAYVAQKWDEVRLLVWAHPGRSAMDRRGRQEAVRRQRDPGLDREAPENWLESGKPAQSLPEPTELVDMVLPASDTPYRVAAPPFKVRHLTVERGATLASQMKVQDVIKSIWGNVWIRDGGRIDMFCLHIEGDAHTFFRNDNRPAEPFGSARGHGNYICYWMVINKRGGGSLEFLGDIRLGDELKFNQGTTIVGPDTKVMAGPPSIQIVGPEAVLEIQSGGFFGKHSPTPRGKDILVLGELRAGSPQRPLTRDAILGLNAKPNPQGMDKVDLNAALAGARKHSGNVNTWGGNTLVDQMSEPYSLAVSPGAKVNVFSSDPQKARLRIQWSGVVMSGLEAGRHRVNALLLSDQVLLDGVVFDYFPKGGVLLLDEGLRSKWKNVVFGEHNDAKGDELFTASRR